MWEINHLIVQKCDGPTVEVDESKKLLKIFVFAFITGARLKPFETIWDQFVHWSVTHSMNKLRIGLIYFFPFTKWWKKPRTKTWLSRICQGRSHRPRQYARRLHLSVTEGRTDRVALWGTLAHIKIWTVSCCHTLKARKKRDSWAKALVTFNATGQLSLNKVTAKWMLKP